MFIEQEFISWEYSEVFNHIFIVIGSPEGEFYDSTLAFFIFPCVYMCSLGYLSEFTVSGLILFVYDSGALYP